MILIKVINILKKVKKRIILKFFIIVFRLISFFFLNKSGVIIIIKNILGLNLIFCFILVKLIRMFIIICIIGSGMMGIIWLNMFEKVIDSVKIMIRKVNFILLFFFILNFYWFID